MSPSALAIHEVDPPSPAQTLKAALRDLADARAALEAAEAEATRRADTAAAYDAALTDARSRIESNTSVEAADHLVEAELKARARATAARNISTNAATARDRLRQRVLEAERAVDYAATAILLAEARAEFEAYARSYEQMREKRGRVLALYEQIGHEALTPHEWLHLDQPWPTVAQLQIGTPPEMNIPVCDLASSIAVPGRPLAGPSGEDAVWSMRARIAAERANWAARLEQLKRGEIQSEDITRESGRVA